MLPTSRRTPGAVPTGFSKQVEPSGTVVPCPSGGEVAINASVLVEGDTDSEAGRIEWGMSQVHNACAAVSDDGRAFMLWAHDDEGLVANFVVENDGQGLVEWVGSVTGMIDWQTDGKEGTCEIAYEFSGELVGEESFSGSAAGTVCGVQVSESFQIG